MDSHGRQPGVGQCGPFLRAAGPLLNIFLDACLQRLLCVRSRRVWRNAAIALCLGAGAVGGSAGRVHEGTDEFVRAAPLQQRGEVGRQGWSKWGLDGGHSGEKAQRGSRSEKAMQRERSAKRGEWTAEQKGKGVCSDGER